MQSISDLTSIDGALCRSWAEVQKSRSVHGALFVLALCATAACSGDDPLEGVPDAALADAGRDAAATDAGPRDALAPDAAIEDAGTDAGGSDPDSGRDAGPPRRGLLAYEPFDAPAGLVTATSGGFGFRTPWVGAGRILDDGLDARRGAQALVVAGGALDANDDSSRRDLDTDGLDPEVSDTPGKLGRAGGSVWISFVARWPRGIRNGEFGGLQLYDGDSAEFRFIGAPFYDSGDPADLPNWGFDQPTAVYTRHAVTTEAALIVVRVEFGIPDEPFGPVARTSMWVNPGLTDDPDALGAAGVILESDDFRVNRVQVSGRPGFQFDELRIGETLGDVVPSVAEPAAPIATESFVTMAGPIFGNEGAFGWAAGWTSSSGTSSGGTIEASGLTYMSGARTLATPGGALLIDTAGPTPQRAVDLAGIAAPGVGLGAPGTTVWLSYLAALSTKLGDGRFAGVQLYDTTAGGALEERFFIGAPRYLAAPAPGDERLRHWGIDRPLLGGPPIYGATPIGGTALMLVRIEADATSSRAALWIDPPLGGADLGAPEATMDAPPFTFDHLRVNANAEGFRVDEIRVGHTALSVLPEAP